MVKGYYKSNGCLLLVFLQFSRIKMIRSQNLKKKCFSIKETDSNVSLWNAHFGLLESYNAQMLIVKVVVWIEYITKLFSDKYLQTCPTSAHKK